MNELAMVVREGNVRAGGGALWARSQQPPRKGKAALTVDELSAFVLHFD